MKRRDFLRLSSQLTIAQAGATLAACGDDSDDSSPASQIPSDAEVELAVERFPQSVASGDPKPTSVVLWTRAFVDAESPLTLLLQFAHDDEFNELVTLDGGAELEMTAEPSSDHCVRIRLDELEPATTYYYRFVFQDEDGAWRRSRTGRTKTAPASDSDDPVRFAVLSCQDYSSRYYHSHARMAELDLDFVVHLGDYVYETADNPDFQDVESERALVFDDDAGVLEVAGGGLTTTGATFQAARSLDNYRNLYRVYRSDRSLQTLHERFPMIVIWDDHEFSNDAFGQSGTYTNDSTDERDAERRANADQAWFEYMPVDYRAGQDFEFDPDDDFPENLEIYRDFRFGKNLHLVMTDLRRYRADHVIPEGALPGAIAVTAEELADLEPNLPDELATRANELVVPYIDVESYAGGEYFDFLTAQTSDGLVAGFTADKLAGPLSVAFVNQLLLALDADGVALDVEPIDAADAELPQGIAYEQLGKTDEFTSFSSRYFVDADVFELIARSRYLQTDGESEQVMGDSQETWFIETLQASDATWKVWGNEYTLMQRRANLNLPIVPAEFRRNYFLSAEDWDGMPNRRSSLLGDLSGVDNLVVFTGDIHSFFAGNLGVEGGEDIFEFVCGAASSATFQAILGGDSLPVDDVEGLAELAGPLLQASNPHLAFQDISQNGFGVVSVESELLSVEFHRLPFDSVLEPELDGDLADHFDVEQFRIEVNDSQLQRRDGDEWLVWDQDKAEWA